MSILHQDEKKFIRNLGLEQLPTCIYQVDLSLTRAHVQFLSNATNVMIFYKKKNHMHLYFMFEIIFSWNMHLLSFTTI